MSFKADSTVPEIVLTMGDPAGVGPEVLAKAAGRALKTENVSFTVVGDRDVMLSAFTDFCPEALFEDSARFNFIDPGGSLDGCISGKPDERGALKALMSIEKAVDIVLNGDLSRPKALVTAPVSKENISRVRKGFIGHTELLQDACKSDFVSMAFVGEHLRVVPVTRHIPLKDVPRVLTKDLVFKTIRQVVKERGMMSLSSEPVIMVTALNPHGGEGGKIGNEEKEVIEPAVKMARGIYPAIEGPVASDVAFFRALSRPGSIVIAMYHDQCLGPFKMLDFDNGVNLTLGLGIVRTSPDHGTAFDISGKGIADPASMTQAIKLAIKALSAAGLAKRNL